MNVRHGIWLLALGALFLVGCGDSSTATAGPGTTVPSQAGAPAGEIDVPIDQLPAAVTAAARKAVPGIVLSEAERETENGTLVYDLEGAVDGKRYELEVTAEGTVIDVEDDDDDDDDDDNDDDDD